MIKELFGFYFIYIFAIYSLAITISYSTIFWDRNLLWKFTLIGHFYSSNSNTISSSLNSSNFTLFYRCANPILVINFNLSTRV
jgi:hypothetical protein